METFLEPKSLRGVLWGDKIVEKSCLDMELGLRLPTNGLPHSFGPDLVHDAGNSKGDLYINWICFVTFRCEPKHLVHMFRGRHVQYFFFGH